MSKSFFKFSRLPPHAPEPRTTADPSSTSRYVSTKSSESPSGSKSELHIKKPSIGSSSIASHRSTESCYRHKSLWDREDPFLPRAKPPPPLPRLEKHTRMRSQHNIQSPSSRPSTSHGTYRHPYATSSGSMSTDPSSYDGLVLDISAHPRASHTPKPLSRTNTRVTASSGTSEEPVTKPQWTAPSCWAGPHAWVDPDEPKERTPARSLSRSKLKRAPSHSRVGREPASRPKTPEPEAFQLVSIVGSGEGTDRSKRPSTGVKVQCYEGWNEKPAEDVVHMLRELRFK